MTAAIVYALCAITSMLCAALLGRAWARSRAPLLAWSCCCFVLLTANNLLVVVDLVIVRTVDLSLPRAVAGALAALVLVAGLVWEDGR